MRRCKLEDCEEIHKAQGYCQRHYDRKVRAGELTVRTPSGICRVIDCNEPTSTSGLCSKHRKENEAYWAYKKTENFR